MARNASRIKLGYYPLPPAEGARLRRLLDFAPGASAVDPCAGTGAALHQLTEGAQAELHGVELDAVLEIVSADLISWIIAAHTACQWTWRGLIAGCAIHERELFAPLP
jgi:hypothetical protein